MSHIPQQTARGHLEPYAVLFSVFMQNRVGSLRDLLDAVGEKEVRVLGISVSDSADWAVVRLVFDDPERARAVLTAKACGFSETEVLLVELDGDAALRAIFTHLVAAEVNVHFGLLLSIRSHDHPVLALHVDDEPAACQVLRRHGIVLLDNRDLPHAPGG